MAEPVSTPGTVACVKTEPVGAVDTDTGIKAEPGDPETVSSSEPGSVANTETNAIADYTIFQQSCGSQRRHDSNFRPIPGRGKFMYVDVSEPIPDSETDEDTKSEPITDAGTQDAKTAAEAGVSVKVEPVSESEAETSEVEEKSTGETFSHKTVSVSAEGVRGSASEMPIQNHTLKETTVQIIRRGRFDHHQTDMLFSCHRCEATFEESDHFNQHVRSHAGLKPFPCPKCEYSFRSNSHLKIHLRIHTGERPFSCHRCDGTFSRPSSLRSHMSSKHNPAKQRVYSCSECAAVFTTSSEVKEHKRVHKDSLSCGECKAHFSCSRNLQRHLVKFHTSTHPFQCSDCTAAFSCRDDLEHHKSVHSQSQGEPLPGDFQFKGEPVTGRETWEVTMSKPIADSQAHSNSKPIADSQAHSNPKPITDSQAHSNSVPEPVRAEKMETTEAATKAMTVTVSEDEEEAAETVTEEKPLRRDGEEAAETVTEEKPLRRDREEATEAAAEEERGGKEESSDPGLVGFVIKEEPLSESETDMEEETAAENRVSNIAETEDGTFRSTAEQQSEDEVVRTKQSGDEETQDSQAAKEGLPPSRPKSNATSVSRSKVKGSGRETPEKMPFVCQCGASYTKFGDLSQHVKIHFGARPFPCSECGATFTTPSLLKSHMTTHSGEKPFSCKECDAAFARPSELKSHTLRRHTSLEKRPHPCPQCPSAFLTRWELKEHRQIHSGAKPFACKACGAVFSCVSYLKRHALRKHTPLDTRPYPCSGCPAAFRSSYELKRHEKVHTGEKPFQCEECRAVFTQSSSLQSHVKRKHSAGAPRPFPFPCPPGAPPRSPPATT